MSLHEALLLVARSDHEGLVRSASNPSFSWRPAALTSISLLALLSGCGTEPADSAALGASMGNGTATATDSAAQPNNSGVTPPTPSPGPTPSAGPSTGSGQGVATGSTSESGAGTGATGATGAVGEPGAGTGATGAGATGATGAGMGAAGAAGEPSSTVGPGSSSGPGDGPGGGGNDIDNGAGGMAGMGGAPTGTGGAAGEGNGEETDVEEPSETCPLPDTFRWTSTGPIAQPREGWASIKDFTALFHDGQYIVYMTNHDMGTSWGAAMFTFSDWADAATATQQPMGRSSVAPTMFYFAPKDVWVLAYQWGSTSFSYATSSDPTDPSSWSREENLYDFNGSLPNSGTGPIDQHVICDDTDCYLFFNGDNGEIYRSSMPIDDFPGTFGPHETIMSRSTNELFEAVAVYSLKGSDEYLMLMESIGSNGRYFSAFTASDLGGEWTDLRTREADPFAGRSNVTFEGNAWTNDISHGDIVRYNPDQTMEIDPCHMELLYQGRDPGLNPEYGLLPYRPGLLTLVR